MTQGCEQFFIEIGRGNRAKDVLRASRMQPPSCFPLAKAATGQTPKPSCVWGMYRHAPWAGGMRISG